MDERGSISPRIVVSVCYLCVWEDYSNMAEVSTTSLPKVVIIGSSGHAKVVIDIIEKAHKHEIVGLIDSFKAPGTMSFGYSVLGDEFILPSLVSNCDLAGCFIAIGDNWNRSIVSEKISTLAPNLPFISPIHPSAQIARNVTVGFGTVLMAGAIVNSDSKIGNFCILNTKASVDHDNIMEDFSSLAQNATTGGNVHIGAFSAVSLGANIINGQVIGIHAVIGAGAVVTNNIPDFCVAHGVPAKISKQRKAGDKYL